MLKIRFLKMSKDYLINIQFRPKILFEMIKNRNIFENVLNINNATISSKQRISSI